MQLKGKQINWNFDNSYLKLPEKLYYLQSPDKVPKPEIFLFNEKLADDLGLESSSYSVKDITEQLSGNLIPQYTTPFAQAYAGHQFGHFTMLGDGRAIVLGEHVTSDGRRFDIQLKGSGKTPFSRRGDGKATLISMLREYLISHAMHNLGIPTSRSLAVVKTGELVYREDEHLGAVLTRVSSSHIRVGTFEYVRQFLSKEELEQFTNYVIDRHYPHLVDAQNPALSLLEAVMERQIELVVHWMRVGFIHGVMNTDNTSITGETFDYGPCAFMNEYSPKTVFSSIDTGGRYAYGNQPSILQWNLSILAGALLPLIDENQDEAIKKAQELINRFPNLYFQKWYKMMFNKLGILNPNDKDRSLVDDLVALMEEQKLDYTNTFLYLTHNSATDCSIYQEANFVSWFNQWIERVYQHEELPLESFVLMERNNPAYIPRNHLVEEALQAAAFNDDLAPFERLLKVLKSPYTVTSGYQAYQAPPKNGNVGHQTFCGT
jgi:serine/tyrosine/threonine adenylyltransferase